MSEPPIQKELLGILFLIFLLGNRGKGPGLFGSTAGFPGISELGKSLRLEDFARDMHRIVSMMDQMEDLSRIAGLSQLAAAPPQETSQLMELAGPFMEMLGLGKK